jgi:hypothetical protein
MHFRPIALIICGLALMAALAVGTVLLSTSMGGGASADSEREPGRAGLVLR